MRASKDLLAARVQPYEPLPTRLDPGHVAQLIDTAAPAAPTEEAGDMITIEDFAKIDLRIARVVQAELVDGADKLLKLALDVDGQPRTVFAGIRQAYEPDALVGRHVVVVANLKPRKMRFGLSEGMVLCAGPGGADLFLVSPDEGAASGMTVK